jgi:small multidrug resistance family-3 protein
MTRRLGFRPEADGEAPEFAALDIHSLAAHHDAQWQWWASLSGAALMLVLRTSLLFLATAIAEILGCYLSYLWLRHGKSAWLLLPAAGSLAVFAWLLTLHPSLPAGRTYAAYGGVYVATALLWLWRVERLTPDRWDLIGAVVTLAGMAIIAFGPRAN